MDIIEEKEGEVDGEKFFDITMKFEYDEIELFASYAIGVKLDKGEMVWDLTVKDLVTFAFVNICENIIEEYEDELPE